MHPGLTEFDARFSPELIRLWWRLEPQAPDPAAANAGLQRFLAAASAAEFDLLRADPSLLQALVAIFSHSQFLSEALIQTPGLLLWLEGERGRARGGADSWREALAAFAGAAPADERARWLTRFRRREYLRIVLRDLQGLAPLAETTAELSLLAGAVLDQAYGWAWNDLAARHGTPADAGGVAEMAVIGLGKLGGDELNYSSDIDLMFVYSGRAEEEGAPGAAEAVTNREFFTRLAQAITTYVSAVTAEGPAYRVDLRLRPGGREGDLALPLQQAVRYYREQARDWELQMLIRAHPCAGARRVGLAFLDAVRNRVYPPRPDPAAVAAGVRWSRQRISAQLERHRAVGRRGGQTDVKLDPGGIRDIEFLVQYLQRLHGGAEPWVRHANTLIAMQRLHDKNLLSSADFQGLASAYWLLRQIEHRLQLHLGMQTHALPAVVNRLAVLARSLRQAAGGRSELAGEAAADAVEGAQFQAGLDRRMAEVRVLYERYLGPAGAGGAEGGGAGGAVRPSAPPTRVAERAWEAAAPGERHAGAQWRRLLHSLAAEGEPAVARLQLPPPQLRRAAAAVAAGDWIAEALIRRGALLHELATRSPGAGAEPLPGLSGEASADMRELRLWWQRRTLACILEELERPRPVAASLGELTALAEAVLGHALSMARGGAAEAPSLCVLGLGRLGLGEMDLLSDMDLVFVADDGEREAASRLAAKWIGVLTAYTQEGGLYAVDARLRPGGGEGELVQSPAGMAAYFEQRAGAWEAVSYLKARVVAGNAGTGGAALAGVLAALPRRFGSPGRLFGALRALRDRIEREGHPGPWGVKTPAGGYYDTDFLTAALPWPTAAAATLGLAERARRLAGEGLEPAEAEALAAATTRLRAADHALRVGTGKAGSAVPAAGPGLDRAWEWFQRIHPPTGAATLRAVVDGARQNIREIFLRFENRAAGAIPTSYD